MTTANHPAETGRTLVREVLFAQLAFAAVVGVIALGCVWWVANWVVRDNLDDWAARWIGRRCGPRLINRDWTGSYGSRPWRRGSETPG